MRIGVNSSAEGFDTGEFSGGLDAILEASRRGIRVAQACANAACVGEVELGADHVAIVDHDRGTVVDGFAISREAFRGFIGAVKTGDFDGPVV